MREAEKIGLPKDKPNYLHYFAEVYLSQSDWLRARQYFEASYQASLSVPDPFFELNSLGDLAKIAVIQHDLAKREEFRRRFEDFRNRNHGIRYRLPEALLMRYLGDMYLLGGELSKALKYYQVGLPQVAENGSYAPYTIQGQLYELEGEVLSRTSRSLVRELGSKMEQFWNSEDLGVSWPEALPFFARWKNWSEH